MRILKGFMMNVAGKPGNIQVHRLNVFARTLFYPGQHCLLPPDTVARDENLAILTTTMPFRTHVYPGYLCLLAADKVPAHVFGADGHKHI